MDYDEIKKKIDLSVPIDGSQRNVSRKSVREVMKDQKKAGLIQTDNPKRPIFVLRIFNLETN